MCGIVGVTSRVPATDRNWLASATEALAHRGPDGSGIWWSDDGRTGLGHRRLAILDLTPGAGQPMHLRVPGLSIVFNGEIYNYTDLRKTLLAKGFSFKTESDTEVLLSAYAAWGEDCVRRLTGMFAFAIYDATRHRLFFARDRAGEKPLFYHQTDDSLYFASELKALFANPAMPRRIDPVSLDCYLTLGSVPGDRCILQGYRKLAPGCTLTYDIETGQAVTRRYWALPEYSQSPHTQSVSQLTDELERVLLDAIRSQLRADVPVGVLLSGGLDSSIITALASRCSDKLQTFSVCFPGHASIDETPHSRLVARHFRTSHTEIVATPGELLSLPQLAAQFDEPMVDSSVLPTWIVCSQVRRQCAVAIGGDGGDELFGGYTHYASVRRLCRLLQFFPRTLRSLPALIAEKHLPIGLLGRSWLMRSNFDLKRGLPPATRFFDRHTRRRLLRGTAPVSNPAEQIRAAMISQDGDIIQRFTRFDFNTYLADDILVKTDRASMLTSLELRSPFLDRHVVDFAYGCVPTSLKVTKGNRKVLLKRLASRLLPDEFDLNRKQGFSIPLSAWLNTASCRSFFEDIIASQNFMFDRDLSQMLLRRQNRFVNNSERVFGLIMFQLWRNTYNAYL